MEVTFNMDTTTPLINTVSCLSQIGPIASSVRLQDALAEQPPSAETAFRCLGMEFNDWIGATTVSVAFEQLFESSWTDICTNAHRYIT